MFRKATVDLISPQWGQIRGMATLKDISNRLKSVKNIQKITQSMKMVSAAKYARAERELKKARPYGAGANAFYEALDPKPPTERKTELVVALTSDRGLCGAVHSSISKQIKQEYKEKPANVDYKVICVGDKSKAQLQALCKKDFVATMNDVGKTSPTFEDASAIADVVVNSGVEFETAKLFYNRFKSVVSYETKALPIYREETVAAAEKLNVYDSVDADVLKMYMEFSLASQIYFVMKEAACSEQSSRMTAMDAASKNAGEMIDKLSLTYNRTRQAVITRELIEIISGASAL